MLETLDAMEDKELYSGSFSTKDGEFCVLGAVGSKFGIKTDDLGDESYCDIDLVGSRFGIAPAMAAEIMYHNDECLVDEWEWKDVEFVGPVRPHWPDYGQHTTSIQVYNSNHASDRWKEMRAWVISNIIPDNTK